jgi:hypothetical protein
MAYAVIALPLIYANPYFTDDTDRLVNLPRASLATLLWSPSGHDHWTPITFLLAGAAIRLGGANHLVYSSLVPLFTGVSCLALALLLRTRWRLAWPLVPLCLAGFALNSLLVFASIWTCGVLDAVLAFGPGFLALWLAWPRCSERRWPRLAAAVVDFDLSLLCGSPGVVFLPLLLFLACSRWRSPAHRLGLAGAVVVSFAVFIVLRAEVNRSRPAKQGLYEHLKLSEVNPGVFLSWAGVSGINGVQGVLLGQHSNAVARRLAALPGARLPLAVLGVVPALLMLGVAWKGGRRGSPHPGFFRGVALSTDCWLAGLMLYTGAGLFYSGRPQLLPFADPPYYYVPQLAGLPLLGASLIRHTRLGERINYPAWRTSLLACSALVLLGVGVGVGTRTSGYTRHYEENLACPTLRGAFFRDLHLLAEDLGRRQRLGESVAPLPDANVNESILAGCSRDESAGCNPYLLSEYSRSLAPAVAQERFWQPAGRRDVSILPGHAAEWFYRKYFPRMFK